MVILLVVNTDHISWRSSLDLKWEDMVHLNTQTLRNDADEN